MPDSCKEKKLGLDRIRRTIAGILKRFFIFLFLDLGQIF
jgi:hypothetical protein